jgi:hypothetical protein
MSEGHNTINLDFHEVWLIVHPINLINVGPYTDNLSSFGSTFYLDMVTIFQERCNTCQGPLKDMILVIRLARIRRRSCLVPRCVLPALSRGRMLAFGTLVYNSVRNHGSAR